MKTLLTAVSLFFVIATSTLAQHASLSVDPKASQLTWTGYAEIGSWAPSGTIQLQKGQVLETGGRISRGTFVVDMTTLQHENGKLQTHLRDEDFFDVAHFPTATFVLTNLTGTTATGQLTIRGVTKPISFPVVVGQEGDGVRVNGKVVVDRTQFAIRYNSSSFFSGLGDYAIKNEFALAFSVLAKPTPTPPTKRGQAR